MTTGKRKFSLFMGILMSILLFTSSAFSADSDQARKLKEGAERAKARVQRIINSVHGIDPHSNIIEMLEVYENDPPALNRLALANISLEKAAVLAEDAEEAFSLLDFDFGNFNFVKSCSQAAISRSRIARANILAIQPPVGFLMAFSTEMLDIVDELADLKNDVGCP